MSTFSDPDYTVLREQRSDREADIVGRLSVLDRRVSRELFGLYSPCFEHPFPRSTLLYLILTLCLMPFALPLSPLTSS